jgi:Na+/H+ antiporter NhaD/arsenite permease-like protein
MTALFLPSLVCLLAPLIIITYSLKGQVISEMPELINNDTQISFAERNIMFFLGIGVLIAVPAFKTITHLPPFMGVLLGLGLLWLVGDLLHRKKPDEEKEHLNLTSALNRIDMASTVFFIGILLAVATLEHSHILPALASWLNQVIGREDVIVLLIGLVSAIVDNVPLVAASIGMYSLEQYPTNSFLWQFLAYCAGTGGSILIIGSAAGVAAMGLERIDFMWYLKKISWLAAIGYLAGALVYIAQVNLLAA